MERKHELLSAPFTWEQFKEQMEYFIDILRNENLTEETKQEINEGMRRLVRQWTNPVMYVPLPKEG